jgi:hypothetical protein
MLPMFIEALRADPPSFPPGLRVKRVQGVSGVWEVTFAPDGRATFAYGDEVIEGQAHVIWRRSARTMCSPTPERSAVHRCGFAWLHPEW